MLEADPNQPAMELNRLWNEGVRNSMQRRTTDATGRFTVTLPGLFAVADATNALRYAYRRTYVPPPTDELSPRATVGAALMETSMLAAHSDSHAANGEGNVTKYSQHSKSTSRLTATTAGTASLKRPQSIKRVQFADTGSVASGGVTPGGVVASPSTVGQPWHLIPSPRSPRSVGARSQQSRGSDSVANDLVTYVAEGGDEGDGDGDANGDGDRDVAAGEVVDTSAPAAAAAEADVSPSADSSAGAGSASAIASNDAAVEKPADSEPGSVATATKAPGDVRPASPTTSQAASQRPPSTHAVDTDDDAVDSPSLPSPALRGASLLMLEVAGDHPNSRGANFVDSSKDDNVDPGHRFRHLADDGPPVGEATDAEA